MKKELRQVFETSSRIYHDTCGAVRSMERELGLCLAKGIDQEITNRVRKMKDCCEAHMKEVETLHLAMAKEIEDRIKG